VTEYLLLHALGKALGWPLDDHGVSVIDFQQSGSAGIYPALAEAFRIPWHMVTDGDDESAKFRQQILNRGFRPDDLNRRFSTLPPPNKIEDQLIADGHAQLLREVLASVGSDTAMTCPEAELLSRLKNDKTGYMGSLSLRVAGDSALAQRMPALYVNLITSLRDGNA
jgi:putative ATP-dependent endonuclease of OLD family